VKKSRKKRGIPKWKPYEPQELPPRERAERALTQAHRFFSGSGRYDWDDWLILAEMIPEAESAVREAQAADPDARFDLLDTVMAEFREATANFTNVDFLRSTRNIRRRWKSFYKGLI